MVFDKKLEDYELTARPVWINSFPYYGKIENAVPIQGKFGVDVRLTMEDGCSFDCWGKNLAYLMNVFGPKPIGWIGKDVKIEQNDKGHKVISA